MSRWLRQKVMTKGTDPYLGLVGGPEPGNMGGIGLIIPENPTVDRRSRYTFALGSATFHGNERARLVGFKQLLTIATSLDMANTTQTYPLELQVCDPVWHFPDGNVIWYFRTTPVQSEDSPHHEVIPDGTAIDLFPDNAAMLCYHGESHPIANGIPPGNPIPELPAFNAMVYPYGRESPGRPLNIELPTPCRLFMYASVWQPDNDSQGRSRPRPADTSVFKKDNGIIDEALFWAAFTDAIYYRIGCEFTVERKLAFGTRCSTP